MMLASAQQANEVKAASSASKHNYVEEQRRLEEKNRFARASLPVSAPPKPKTVYHNTVIPYRSLASSVLQHKNEISPPNAQPPSVTKGAAGGLLEPDSNVDPPGNFSFTTPKALHKTASRTAPQPASPLQQFEMTDEELVHIGILNREALQQPKSVEKLTAARPASTAAAVTPPASLPRPAGPSPGKPFQRGILPSVARVPNSRIMDILDRVATGSTPPKARPPTDTADRIRSQHEASGSGASALESRFPKPSGFPKHTPLHGTGLGVGGRTRDLIHVGLKNLGNTCFMNATLQALLGLETFVFDLAGMDVRDLRLPSTSLYAALLECAQRLWLPVVANHRRHPSKGALAPPASGQSISPGRLKAALEARAPMFRGTRQHDAHEFLVALLDSLEQEILTAQAAKIGKNDIPISEALCPTARNCTFVVARKVVCSECQYESEGKELYNHLSVEVPEPSHAAPPPSLEALVRAAFQPEEIRKRCEKCGCQDAHHVIHRSICLLPRSLIVHLKRFRSTAPRPAAASNPGASGSVTDKKQTSIASFFYPGAGPRLSGGFGGGLVRKVTTPVVLADRLVLASVCAPGPSVPPLHPRLRHLDAVRGKENDDASPDLGMDLSLLDRQGPSGAPPAPQAPHANANARKRASETVIVVDDADDVSAGAGTPRSASAAAAHPPPSQRRRIGSPPSSPSHPAAPGEDLDVAFATPTVARRPRAVAKRHELEDSLEEEEEGLGRSLPPEEEEEVMMIVAQDDDEGDDVVPIPQDPVPVFRAVRVVADASKAPTPGATPSLESPDLGAPAVPAVPEYRLTAVVCHLGTTPSSGHYVADRIDVSRDRWLRFNDSMVLDLGQSRAEFLQDAARQRDAYLLVYASQGSVAAPKSVEGVLEALGSALQ